MFAIFLWVLIGFGMAFFATQNVSPATITLANYTFYNIPLYAIVIGSLLVGLLLSWLISLINGISSVLTLRDKESTIKSANKAIDDLKRENKRLELEVARIKGESGVDMVEEKSHKRPSFWNRWRHSY